MRHAFRFPTEVQAAVRNYVRNAVARLQPQSYEQEHAYTSALAGRLDGVVYEGKQSYVEFHATIANDRARGSAEFWSGTDFVIHATIRDENYQVDKAIIFQAKKGDIAFLKNSERNRLIGQIEKMKSLTRAPKILEVPDGRSKLKPAVVSANSFIAGYKYQQISLEDYFVWRVLTTLDGDTRPAFVNNVQRSSLVGLKVFAKIHSRTE